MLASHLQLLVDHCCHVNVHLIDGRLFDGGLQQAARFSPITSHLKIHIIALTVELQDARGRANMGCSTKRGHAMRALTCGAALFSTPRISMHALL